MATDVATAGIGSLFAGLLGGYTSRKEEQWRLNMAEATEQRREERKRSAEAREQEQWESTVSEGKDIFQRLLSSPQVSPNEALLELSTFDQSKKTKFAPLYAEVMKQRESIPFFKGENGEMIQNPSYVPKWMKRTLDIPDVKRNRLWVKTGHYDPLTNQWQLDPKTKEPIWVEEKTVGKLFDTNKTGYGQGGKGISKPHQENLNKLAAAYIKGTATVQAVEEQGNTQDILGEATPAYAAAVKNQESAKITLDKWVDTLLPAGENAADFLEAFQKFTRGKIVSSDKYWKKVLSEYKKGTLTDLDVQLLAYKHLVMYGSYPKNYIPAFSTSGEIRPEEEDATGSEEETP